MWQGWINLILGIWLIISGLIPSLQVVPNMLIVGILGAVFGFWLYKMWQGIVNGILGLWLIVSSLLLNLVLPLNFIIVGIVMGGLGVWSALTHRKEMTTKMA